MVLAAYYIFGWQAAVLLLPFLFLVVSQKLGFYKAKQGRKRPRKWVLRSRRLVFRMITFGLPIFAVVAEQQEVMRLWAYLVSAFLFLPSVFSRSNDVLFNTLFDMPLKAARALMRATTVIAALMFILLSEIAWVFLGFTAWIWFHAFSFPFGMASTTLLFAFAPILFGYKRRFYPDPKIVRGKPPKPESENDRNRYKTIHVRWDHASREFGELTVDQAVEMFRRIKWHTEIQKQVNQNKVEDRYPGNWIPKFFVTFSTFEKLHVYADFENSFTVQIERIVEGKPFINSKKHYEAHRVPKLVVMKLMEHMWLDRWPAVERLLSTYLIAERRI